MKRITHLLLLTAMLSMLAVATAYAETTVLPTILLAIGTSGQTVAENATAKTAFTGIVNLTGEGYKFELNQTTAMTSLGKGLLTFLKAKLLGKSCKSASDTAGTVLVPIEWHSVLALGGGAKLALALLLVTPALTVECEGTTITVSGSQGVDAEPFGTKGKEGTGSTGSKCPFNVYTNDNNEMITGGLKSETGGLKAATCQEIEGTIKFTGSVEAEAMQP